MHARMLRPLTEQRNRAFFSSTRKYIPHYNIVHGIAKSFSLGVPRRLMKKKKTHLQTRRILNARQLQRQLHTHTHSYVYNNNIYYTVCARVWVKVSNLLFIYNIYYTMYDIDGRTENIFATRFGGEATRRPRKRVILLSNAQRDI